ncbi:N-acetyl-gamma-glutamyl-phosphate reductase [Ruminococcaceae bacterium OttesenSCG-928-A16]|nr:N-acetyl-gamma-glutamyl-phosphate reductase [Ruminococcaceae bacterium OttesenSCG-928-A16]
MNTYAIYIDGAAGTTGLRIQQRLAGQPGLKLLTLPEGERKNLAARLRMIENVDLSILCLPDDAAAEIAAAANPKAKIIDASTAHRTNPGWAYGLPELAGQRSIIQHAARVAVPGCHASGFLALVAPLVQNGWLAANTQLYCHSLTGYSGGGKQMIAEYESQPLADNYDSPRAYALSLQHKHLPEMQAVAGLTTTPLFNPIVANYYSGMLVSVPLPACLLAKAGATPAQVAQFYTEYYAGQPLIKPQPFGTAPPDGFLPAGALAGQDGMELFVLGNQSQILLAARYDNLGKGASGAAIQCMNIMLGRPETVALVV